MGGPVPIMSIFVFSVLLLCAFYVFLCSCVMYVFLCLCVWLHVSGSVYTCFCACGSVSINFRTPVLLGYERGAGLCDPDVPLAVYGV